MIEMVSTKSTRQKRIMSFSLFAIPFLVWSVYLLAFYPGILSFDSVSQWDQMSRFNFSDWHPAYHTILMWLITRIWYSPAAIAVFQILIFSVIIGYVLSTFGETLDIPFVLLIAIDIVVSVFPLNAMMVITLWKDVLYSVFVLLLTIYLLKIIQTKGDWINSGYNWIYFGLAVANVSLLRHNGFPVALGSLLICVMIFRNRKYFLMAFGLALIFVVVVKVPIYKFFKVDMTSSQSAGVVFVHPIAAQIHAGSNLTQDERDYVNKIYPLENGWPYSCYDATVLFYKGVNFSPVQEHPTFAAETFLRLTLENPKVTLKHFVCLSSFVWQINQPKDVYLEAILTSSMDINAYPDWKLYHEMIAQNPMLPKVHRLIVKVVDAMLIADKISIIWRPAIYLYAFVLSVLVFVVRNKDPLYFILLIPILLQSLIIGLTAQLQAVRYQYAVYITAMLYTIPLIYSVARGVKAAKNMNAGIPKEKQD